jgi:hypothetical protein
MNSNIRHNLILVIVIFLCQPLLKAQINDEVIFSAMNDELNRNISNLNLGEYKPPFFVGFRINYANILSIKASLGSIVHSEESIGKSPNVRLMVGDYSLNDENFVSSSKSYSSGSFYLPLPLDNNYGAIRRSLWIMTDRVYKSAIEKYEQKLTALKQQNKEESEKLDDYSKVTSVNMILRNEQVKFDRTKWENATKNISLIFKAYPQITGSSVTLYCLNSSFYYLTNEGTKIKFPVSIACLLVNANAQAQDGEPLRDHVLYFALTTDQLPPVDKIKLEAKQMADNLTTLCKTTVFEDSYSGPVLFEGDAVAEVFLQKLFGPNGLIASREPVYAVERQEQGAINKFDNKINQRICTENITIKATPKLKSFNNIPLIGNFEIDAEGVVPKDELALVNKGILKTLLNDRVPTPKVKESNGYCRLTIAGNTQKAPGIINVIYNNGVSLDSIRKGALKEAEKNGFDYLYVIRKVEVPNMGMMASVSSEEGRTLPVTKPIDIYQVSVKTGQETLVRSAVVSDFPLTAFKHIIQGTKEQIVYNTLKGSVPVSFIVPRAILFDDISIEKDRGTRPKLPVVSNPVVVAH